MQMGSRNSKLLQLEAGNTRVLVNSHARGWATLNRNTTQLKRLSVGPGGHDDDEMQT